MTEPVPFEVYDEGVYLHGTKTVLRPGALLAPKQPSKVREDAPQQYVYVTENLG